MINSRDQFNRLELLCIYMFSEKLSSVERNYLFYRFSNSEVVPEEIKIAAKNYGYILKKMLEINRRILYTVYEIKKQQAEESDKLKLEKLDKEKEDKNFVAILIDTKNFSVTLCSERYK